VVKLYRKWLAPSGLAFFLALLLTACGPSQEVRVVQGQVGEMLFQVHYLPVNANQTESRVQGRMEGLIAHLEQQFSSTLPDSQISRLNQWDSTQPVVLTRELEEFIFAGLGAYELSGGELPILSVEDQGEPSIQLRNHQLFKSSRNVQVNMDIVLQGFIVDRLAHLMDLMSIEHYQVSLNGQVRASGFNLEREPWVTRVANAGDFGLKNQALGWSNTPKGELVIVVHDTAASASALSFWLAQMNVEEALQKAERLNIPVDILVDENGASKSYTSTAFKRIFSS